MDTLTSSEARKNFAEVLKQAAHSPVVIEKHGSRQAVIISPNLFEELLDAAEELEDIDSFDAAMAEEGENIPWEEAKAELGWH